MVRRSPAASPSRRTPARITSRGPAHSDSPIALTRIRKTATLAAMKATIEIPDDLYRQIEEKSAQQGRPIDAVTIELLQRGLDEEASAPGPASVPDADDLSAMSVGDRSAERWLEDWLRLSEEISRNAPPGPTATEILEADRNRLERR